MGALGGDTSSDFQGDSQDGQSNLLAEIPFLRPDWRSAGEFLVEAKDQVLRRHDPGSAEKMLAMTSLSRERASLVAPWVFSRVFVALLASFLLVALSASRDGFFIYPLLLFLGASFAAVPLALFCLESNAPRNISLYRFGFTAVVGGALVMSLVQFMPLWTTVTTGGIVLFVVVEESLKLAAVIALTYRFMSGGILNGLALGAAVGGGFAVIETAGYLFRFGGMDMNLSQVIEVSFNRGWMNLGTHVLWTGIAAAALWAGRPRGGHFTWALLVRPSFLVAFGTVLAIHIVWNSPLRGFPLWILLVLLTTYIGLTYVVAGRKQFRAWSP